MATYRRSEITKNTILEAATRLFLEKGYTQTTIRDICKESGVSLSRVNYHFSSKAELAQVICRSLFKNFYAALKQIIMNNRRYSFVIEAVALRFLVDLVLEGDNKPEASLFYRDCAHEGIFADIFTSGDRGLFQAYMEADNYFVNNRDIDKKISCYTSIFGASLRVINQNRFEVLAKFGGNQQEAAKSIQDVYAGLFMQMLDIPHDAQKAMVEMSYAYYKSLNVRLIGLIDVNIEVKDLPTLREKVDIIEEFFDRKDIKLKSSKNRDYIDIDSDKTGWE